MKAKADTDKPLFELSGSSTCSENTHTQNVRSKFHTKDWIEPISFGLRVRNDVEYIMLSVLAPLALFCILSL